MPGSGASDLAVSRRATESNLFGVQRKARERQIACVAGGVAQRLLDAQQLVVLGDTLAAGGGARLDLPAADGDGEVGDRGVLGLAAAVAHHRAVAAVVRQRDGVERL